MKVISIIDSLLRPGLEHKNEEPFNFNTRRKSTFILEGNKQFSVMKTGFEATWFPNERKFKVVLIGHVSVHPSIKVEDLVPGKGGGFKKRFCFMNDGQLAGFIKYNFSNRITEFEDLSIEY